jgi:hypothetical protein
MKKFKYGDTEFEMNYLNDVAPVLVATETPDKEVNLKELEEKFKGHKIFSYDTNTYNEETRELKPITYYYIGAECTTAKKYKLIEKYDFDFPPNEMLIEITFQTGNFKAKFHEKIKNINCSMMNLIDNALDQIKEKLFKNEEEEGYSMLFLYDDGGWEIDIEVNENDIENLITSIRLVEEIKN